MDNVKEFKKRLIGYALIYIVLLGIFGVVWYLWLQKALPKEWEPLAYYIVVGGIGGVTAVFFGLYRHASLRDFDAGFLLWYYLKPAIGMVIGPIVYLAGMAGLLATTGKAEVQSHFLLLTAAFVTGFSERFSLSLIDKIGEMVFGTPETSTTAKSQPQATPSPAGE
jgi:hypothetical protein